MLSIIVQRLVQQLDIQVSHSLHFIQHTTICYQYLMMFTFIFAVARARERQILGSLCAVWCPVLMKRYCVLQNIQNRSQTSFICTIDSILLSTRKLQIILCTGSLMYQVLSKLSNIWEYKMQNTWKTNLCHSHFQASKIRLMLFTEIVDLFYFCIISRFMNFMSSTTII